MKKIYRFVVNFFDVPTQKFRGRCYLGELDGNVEDTAKCFIALYKTFPDVKSVTLKVFDLEENLLFEV